MLTLLLLGFLIGMRHALEADHIAAVASLATQKQTLSRALTQGAFWGIGHTLALFIFGSAVIWMDTVMKEALAEKLEFAVGVMLVVLGLDVLRRVIRDRVHFHRHKHENTGEHFHAHSHLGEGRHQRSPHEHQHSSWRELPFKALFVGLMHGMAGSAALILLTLQTIQDKWMGMVYILLFGFGSIVGMAALSFAIAIPLQSSARHMTFLHNGLQAVIGVFTVSVGLFVCLQ